MLTVRDAVENPGLQVNGALKVGRLYRHDPSDAQSVSAEEKREKAVE